MTLICVAEAVGSADGLAARTAPFPLKNLSRFASGVKISTNWTPAKCCDLPPAVPSPAA